jgi:predicted RND superfamily exporter protein
MPFVELVFAATVFFAIQAAEFDTEFDGNAQMPSGGDAVRDIETLDEAFGGSTEAVQVLVEAELTEDRAVRNVVEFNRAFSDDLRRPDGVVGDIQSLLGLLLADWITNSGAEDDRYDGTLLEMA